MLSELNDAASYYHAQERAGLVAAFLKEVERVLSSHSAKPLAGSTEHADMRRWRLRKFPYSIIYRVTSNSVRIPRNRRT